MTLQELFSENSRWIQKNYARTSQDGYPVDSSSPEAGCFCLMGGINKCYPNRHERIAVQRKIHDVLTEQYDQPSRHLYVDDDAFWSSDLIIEWNDASERTIEEIRNVVKLANV